MPLREAELHIRFSGGVETKADPKAVPTTQLLALENGVFTKAISIQKRNGYESLGNKIDNSISTVTDLIRTASRGDELLAFTANHCYSRQSGEDQWSDAGPAFSIVGTDRPLVGTATQQTMPDHATISGVTVAAWEDSNGGVWWNVEDSNSGRIFRAPTQADAAGISPRCVVAGSNLHIYYVVAALRRLMVIVVNPAAPSAAVSPTVLIDDLDHVQPMYDAVETTRTDAAAAIAWFEEGSTNIRVGYVDQSGVIGSPLMGYPSVFTHLANRLATSPLGLGRCGAVAGLTDGDADRLVLCYVDAANSGTTTILKGGDNVEPISVLNSFATYATTNVQRVTVAAFEDGTQNAYTAWEEFAAAPSNRFVVTRGVDMTSGPSGSPNTIRSVGLASHAFTINEDFFAVFVHDTTFFNTYFTLRLSDSFPIGRQAPAEAASAPSRQHLPSAHLSGSIARISLPVRQRLVSENNDKFRETSIRLFSLDFDNESSHQTAQLGAGLYMAGGCPTHYDGRAWTEQGFNVGPEVIVTAPAGGGSMTSGTTYEYRYWYEWPDGQAEIHRGPTSVGTVVTMGGGDTQVTHTLPTLRVTQKVGARICVARTLAAKTDKTAQLFRVTSLDPTTAGSANGFVANDPTVDTVSFIDRMDDATLQSQEELYTDGGILSNDPVALGSVIARGKNRLFATDPSDGNLLRYSQALDSGYGVEWPPDLTIPVDPVGGDITGLVFQDGRGFIFKERTIHFVDGDGPTASGDTSATGFTVPQLVSSDVGCIEPGSIVVTPQGYMFKSRKGIELLGRDGSVTYVGSRVEAFNSQRIRRATALPDRTAVIFLTDSGSTLYYDYLFGQWSTFTNHEGFDSAVVNNTYHYIRTDGRVFRETPGIHSDAGTRIKLRLETAWIHMQDQLQGFSEFWYLHLLGTWVSPHQLGVQYQTDFINEWTDQIWLDATGSNSSTGWITGGNAMTIGAEPITGTSYGDGVYGDGAYGGTAADVYQWRLDVNEHGQSIRFAFEDFEASGLTGASFELTEMLLTGGALGNAIKPFKASRSS